MTKSLYAVVNPAAGQPKPVLHTLNSVCRAAGVDWAVSVTMQSGDGRRFAQQALADGFDVVAAFGGDGTVMEVASALMGGDVPVAILPGGTANVMSTELRIPHDLTQACQLACGQNSTTKTVDMGRAGERTFMLRVAMGFDAEVGNIVLDSMTAILSPIVTRILEELERGYHKNRAAAWKPKANTVRLIQDAINKWRTDFVIIYHEQKRLDGRGRAEVANTVSPVEEARIMRVLNARIRLGQDNKGRYAEVVWSRTGRTGKVYDQGMWQGVPEKLDELIWGNLSETEEAQANGAAPAAFADPQAAWDWGVSQGCFKGIEHARNAYEKLKTERSPQNAGQMRDLWVAEVQRRTNDGPEAELATEPVMAEP
jgi:hypothetical protein